MSNQILSEISRIDQSNMLDLILNFTEQVQRAVEIGKEAEVDEPKGPIHQVLITGMGGSAIGGNILQRLFTASCTYPCLVVRDYWLPGWANRNTLVVVSSYSGNTEETLTAYEKAISMGCPCVVCTSGGELLVRARKEGHPYIQIPGGQPPRTALGYLLVPLLVKFVDWGWIKSSLVDWDELYSLLLSIAEENNPRQTQNSPAWKIAENLKDRLPVIYSSVALEPVAMRWKGQLSENSKVLAYHNLFPEMNHNEIVGWQRVAQMGLHQKLAVLLLKDREDHPRVIKRMDVVRELIHQTTTPVFELETRGEAMLTRLFSLIYLADFVSFDLAILNGEDPTPIKNIDYLKSILAKYEF
jgi:glucose/mannose-6-phosphate isomerase